MTINRYRLAHKAKSGERSAIIAQELLQRPDRLIGLIMLGNNLVNILAASVATVIGLRLFGGIGIAVAVGMMTIIILLFAEVTPKTMAALYPERIAKPAAYIYWVLIRIAYPLVWAVNLVSNGLLRLLGVTAEDAAAHSQSTEELRLVVAEAGAMIPQRHQAMLMSILDLEKSTVEDIMIPRNEIVGIDLTDPEDVVRERILNSQHTRLPLYRGSIDDLAGTVHVRDALRAANAGDFGTEVLVALAREPYFILEGTPLNQQLLKFQAQKRRIGFVVDEYGDIQGLVTLADILQEIIGEFTADPATRIKNVFRDNDGSYLVNGNVNLRGLNRSLGWKLPTAGPRTVNGLIMESMEAIPKPGDELRLGQYRFEVTETRANTVKTARIRATGKR